MPSSFKVEGLKEMEKALFEMKSATAKATVRRAMKKAFQPFVDKAREKVSEDDGVLKDSIASSTRLTKNQRREARGSFDRNATVVMYAGAGARHAHLVEFGTDVRRHTGTGKSVGAMPPNPFMREAWEETRGRVQGLLRQELADQIERAAARARRRAGG